MLRRSSMMPDHRGSKWVRLSLAVLVFFGVIIYTLDHTAGGGSLLQLLGGRFSCT